MFAHTLPQPTCISSWIKDRVFIFTVLTFSSLLYPSFFSSVSFIEISNSKRVTISTLFSIYLQDELMSNEQLFFGLSQALRKFPKETGNHVGKEVGSHSYTTYFLPILESWCMLLHLDRILCHFCFKPKRVTNEVLASDNGRRSQIMISSIILLKTALDALPLLSKVRHHCWVQGFTFFWILSGTITSSWFRFLKKPRVVCLEICTRPYVRMKNILQ